MTCQPAADITAEAQRLAALAQSPAVQRVVAEAPPLTRQQVTALRAIFSSSPRETAA
jgi:predicted exporter